MSEPTDAPSDDLSPPTDPEPLEEFEERAKWPTVVGWLSIIFGSLSLTCIGTISILSIVMQDMLMSLIAKDPSISGPPPTPDVPPYLIGLTFLNIAWQAPLILGGITALLRKPASRPLHLLYAMGYAVTYSIGVIVGWQVQQAWVNSPEMVTWLASNAQSAAARGMGKGPNPIVISLSAAFFLAWPVFCLIWFLPAGRSDKALLQDEEDALV